MKKTIKNLTNKAIKNSNLIKGGLTDEEAEVLKTLGGPSGIKTITTYR